MEFAVLIPAAHAPHWGVKSELLPSVEFASVSLQDVRKHVKVESFNLANMTANSKRRWTQEKQNARKLDGVGGRRFRFHVSLTQIGVAE